MSTRATGMGLLALASGVVVLAVTDGMLSTALGVVALAAGVVVVVIAGLRGVGAARTPDGSLRATAADQQRERETSAQTQRAAATGRWPRIIGGG